MNSMYFDKNSRGRMISLLELLLDMSYDDSGRYNDIHIKPEDCGAFSVEWSQERWSEPDGEFKYATFIHHIDKEELKKLLGEKPRFTFTAVDSSTGEPILNGVHLDDDNIVNPKVRKDLGLDTENYEPKKSEHFDFDVSKCAKQEDNVVKPNTNWETKTMLLNAEQEDELRNGTDPKYFTWTEPYKYMVGDD